MKNDKFRKARGDWSRTLEIECEECSHKICKYQKDGPGILKRMYLDRIIYMQVGSANFNCPNCHAELGTKIIYEKESRPAYRLYVGAIRKKIVKSSK